MMRTIQRKFEAFVGRRLIRLAGKQDLKKSGLKQRQLALSSGVPVSYLERGDPCNVSNVIVFVHGLSQAAEHLVSWINQLNLPTDARVLIPDVLGHGQDVKRAFEDRYEHPSPEDILESLVSFLDELGIQNCTMIGYSMGGAMAYILRARRPDLVAKTVLVSPAISCCTNQAYIDDFRQGKKAHHCFENRTDLKDFLRDLAPPQRSRRDPVPKFFLQGIVAERKQTTPSGHYREMMEILLNAQDIVKEMSATNDIDKESQRLVIWPRFDYICDYDKGRLFFQDSTRTKFVTLEDGGHAFMADGTPILFHAVPCIKAFISQEKRDVSAQGDFQLSK